MNYNDLYKILYQGNKDAPYLEQNYNNGEWELIFPKDFKERPPVNDWEYVSDYSGNPLRAIRFANEDDIDVVKKWLIARMISGDRPEAYNRAKALINMLELGMRINNARLFMNVYEKKSDHQNVGYDDLLLGMPSPEPVYARLQSVAEMWRRKD